MSLKRRTAVLVLILGLCPAFACIARAEDAATAAAAAQDPAAQLESLKRYGATHKACDGWSDGCALCARRADGTLGCSRIGVDCEISDIQCTQLARDPKTGLTPPPQ